MPVRGRKPNPDGQRRHRAQAVHGWTEVLYEPFDDGPRLPATMPNGQPWPKATKQWWSAVSQMPHCVLWSATDWQFALDSALVAAAFHIGNVGQARELRSRERVMGTTADALRDLRIRYVLPRPEDEEPAGMTAIEEYRSRLER